APGASESSIQDSLGRSTSVPSNLPAYSADVCWTQTRRGPMTRPGPDNAPALMAVPCKKTRRFIPSPIAVLRAHLNDTDGLKRFNHAPDTVPDQDGDAGHVTDNG